MWYKNWREEIWENIDQEWDLIVVGGGITGAGVFREASRLALRVLLVEQRDFAWGTSSRSSKLVHGGLRYLKEGKLSLTRDSVREREQLLKEAPGLVEPLHFLLATYDGDSPGRLTFGAGLTIYDLLAMRWSHRYYSAQDFRLMAGQLSAEGLEGGYRYGDAQTDDARLVLRLIREGVADGGQAINYVKADSVLRGESGKIDGLRLKDLESDQVADVVAPIIVNATGAWADRLRGQIGADPKIRPLRGSHLIFPSRSLPVAQAVSFLHPVDERPVFLFPWEGVTLVGTTDVDYDQSLDQEPSITPAEVAYLMAAVNARFPLLDITLDDVITTFAGVRPVIGSGKENPSDESRDHVIWLEDGLLTVTGGQLTTFRIVAHEVLAKVRQTDPNFPRPNKHAPLLDRVEFDLSTTCEKLSAKTMRRLAGRYGSDINELLSAACADELTTISGTSILWAELRWAARAEGVVHLDDLLLRRVRLGLLVKNGGQEHFPRIRTICQEELGWDNSRWEQEQRVYLALWNRCYNLPDRSKIPDWKLILQEAKQTQATSHEQHTNDESYNRRLRLALILAGLTVILTLLVARWRRQPAEEN